LEDISEVIHTGRLRMKEALAHSKVRLEDIYEIFKAQRE
jgi:hypothetical protein